MIETTAIRPSKTQLPDNAYKGGSGSQGATNISFNSTVTDLDTPTDGFKTQKTEVDAPIKDSTLRTQLKGSAAADVIFDAYLKRVSKFAYEKFDSNTGAGLNADAVGSLIGTSEAYLKSLGNVTEYRKFIGITLTALRGNYQSMDSAKARNLIRFIDDYSKSRKNTADTANFVKALYTSNLLSMGVGDDASQD